MVVIPILQAQFRVEALYYGDSYCPPQDLSRAIWVLFFSQINIYGI